MQKIYAFIIIAVSCLGGSIYAMHQPLLHQGLQSGSMCGFLNLALGVNEQDDEGCTALHTAAYTGNFAAAVRLVAQGANIETRDAYGETPLYKTAILKQWAMAHYLIKIGAQLNVKNCRGRTPLHAAVLCQAPLFAQLFLLHGADKTIQDNDGLTPCALFRQCAADRNECICLMDECVCRSNISWRWFIQKYWAPVFPDLRDERDIPDLRVDGE